MSPDSAPFCDHTVPIEPVSAGASSLAKEREEVLVVRESGKIVLVHSPEGKTVTIGRSKTSDVRLKDPHIPRHAGEIVLGPVPVFRRAGNPTEKAPEILPILPGIPFRIGHYQVRLLKRGDVFFNYRGLERPSRKFKFLFFFSIASMLVPAMVFFVLNFSPFSSEPEAHSIDGASNQILAVDPPEVSPSVNSRPTIVKQKPLTMSEKKVDCDHPVDLVLQSKEKRRSPAGKIPAVSGPMGIARERFGEIVSAAKSFIRNGSPEQAGRTILPLLPFLSREQESVLVEALEPCLRTLFQRAYMLRAYDRTASGELLGRIASGGLEILPTTRKAREMVDSERQIEAAVREGGSRAGNGTGGQKKPEEP